MSDHGSHGIHGEPTEPEAPKRRALRGSHGCIGSGMTTPRGKLREDVHLRILRLLQDNPEMSQRDLAQAVGISTGGIHYVLKALLEKGLIKLGNFTASEDRRRYAYVVTPKGISEKVVLTRRFLARKMLEYEALRAEIDAVRTEMKDNLAQETK